MNYNGNRYVCTYTSGTSQASFVIRNRVTEVYFDVNVTIQCKCNSLSIFLIIELIFESKHEMQYRLDEVL